MEHPPAYDKPTEELCLIIQQFLKTMGFDDTLRSMVVETRSKMHRKLVEDLQKLVHTGNWEQCQEYFLTAVTPHNESQQSSANQYLYLISREKCLDLIADEKWEEASQSLRANKLFLPDPHYAELNSLIKSTLPQRTENPTFSDYLTRKRDEKYKQNFFTDSIAPLLASLEELVPPDSLPKNRLQVLINQAANWQLKELLQYSPRDDLIPSWQSRSLFSDYIVPESVIKQAKEEREKNHLKRKLPTSGEHQSNPTKHHKVNEQSQNKKIQEFKVLVAVTCTSRDKSPLTKVIFSYSGLFVEAMNKTGAVQLWWWKKAPIPNDLVTLLSSEPPVVLRSFENQGPLCASMNPSVLCLSLNDSYLVASNSGTLNLYVAQTGDFVTSIHLPTREAEIPSAVQYHPIDNNYLVVGTLGGLVLLKKAGKQVRWVITDAKKPITDVVFLVIPAPRASVKVLLLVADLNGHIEIWDVFFSGEAPAFKKLREFCIGSAGAETTISVTSDSKYCIFKQLCLIEIWYYERESFKRINSLRFQGKVVDCCFDTTFRYIYVLTDQNTLLVFRPEKADAIGQILFDQQGLAKMTCLSASSRNQLAVGREDGTLSLIDAPEFQY